MTGGKQNQANQGSNRFFPKHSGEISPCPSVSFVQDKRRPVAQYSLMRNNPDHHCKSRCHRRASVPTARLLCDLRASDRFWLATHNGGTYGWYHEAVPVRCEARSGTTLGGENDLRDGVFPKAPRLIWQAGDKEREPV